MRRASVQAAAGWLAELLALVERCEEVAFTRDGRTVARLVRGLRARNVARAAAAEIRRLRTGVSLGPGLTIRDFIYDGRR